MTVSEAGVGEAIAESVERFAGKITIRSAPHGVTFERRKLFERVIERHRQASTRIVLPSERLSDRGAAFFPGVPRFQNCGSMLLRPRDGESAAVHQHHDQRLPGRSSCFEQILLQLRQADLRSVTATE